MNGVNIEQFQFEYDLTWMSFFQDSEGSTYARYGGRDDADSESYLNAQSLANTMRAVLELHPKKAVKKPSRFEPAPNNEKIRTPADLPALHVHENCVHCHNVKMAQLRQRHDEGTLQKEMVFTYPNPKQLGMVIDPSKQNRITHVAKDSPASTAGLRSGDTILAANGQRILTYGDFTRVLELSPSTGKLPLLVQREGKKYGRTIALPEGWRVSEDPSWRASTSVVGPGAGFWGRTANKQERAKLNLGEDDLALKVTFIWAPHAKAARVKLQDVITDLDGYKQNMNMRQFHAHLQMHRNWGDEIKLVAMRGGKQVELQMTLPAGPSKND